MLTKFQSFEPHLLGVVGKPKNLFIPEATQRYPLGARFKYGQRTFHYAYAGGVALAAGKLVYSTDTPAEANVTVGTAAAIGATSIPNITTTAAETALDGGMMIVNDVAGQGHGYEIQSSSANADTSTSTDVVLRDPLKIALTTSSQVELYSSPYYDLDIATDVNHLIAGVPIQAVTKNYYFWLQTWGPCSILIGDTTVAGELVGPHTTDGSVGPLTAAATEASIGKAMTAGTGSEYNGIFLMLVP